MTDTPKPRPTDARAAKIDETTRVATEIIDAETEARNTKTERLRQARERAQAQESERRRLNR